MAIQTVKTGASVNDGTGDDARTCFTKINQNFTDSANAASRLVGTATGNVMEVGAFGIGYVSNLSGKGTLSPVKLATGLQAGFITGDQLGLPFGSGGLLSLGQSGTDLGGYTALNNIVVADRRVWIQYSTSGGVWQTFELKTTNNTSIDGNGFIKAASPIVKLFADKIELNDEAAQQKITFEKLGVGDYLVKGSTGFAQEGWYIEMPKDANGNVLVAVVYEQLDNNDISVKTYAKMFDPDIGDIVPNTARPRDIPATRWIDLRLQELPQPDIIPATDPTVNTNAE